MCQSLDEEVGLKEFRYFNGLQHFLNIWKICIPGRFLKNKNLLFLVTFVHAMTQINCKFYGTYTTKMVKSSYNGTVAVFEHRLERNSEAEQTKLYMRNYYELSLFKRSFMQ